MRKRVVDSSQESSSERKLENIPLPVQISGIFRVDKMISNSKSYPRTVFLFSDMHINYKDKSCNKHLTLEKCTDESCKDWFPKVLDTLIRSTNEKVDFYIELDIIKQESWRGDLLTFKDFMLTTVWGHFRDCFDPEYDESGPEKIKQKCREKWPNLRYHYADFRIDTRKSIEDPSTNFYQEFVHTSGDKTYTLKGTPMVRLQFMLQSQISQLKWWVSQPFHLRNEDTLKSALLMVEYQNAIKILLGNIRVYLESARSILDHYKSSEVYYSRLFDTPRMKRQFGGIKDPLIEPKIREFIIREAAPVYQLVYKYISELIEKEIVQVDRNLSEPDVKLTLINILDTLILHITHLNSKVMDTYLLARMFRTFDLEPQRNVIIYAGAAHVSTYRRFLSEVGYYHEGYGYLDEKSKDREDFFCTRVPEQFLKF